LPQKCISFFDKCQILSWLSQFARLCHRNSFWKLGTLRAAVWLLANFYNKFDTVKCERWLLFPGCGRSFGFSHLQFV